MNTISNRETALLMLLTEEPMHPYGIEKVIEERSMREWTEISMSSIYKLLIGLEGRGMVASSVALEGSNRPRKIFSITPKGTSELITKYREIITEPESMRWRMDLAVSHLSILDAGEIATCFSEYIDACKALIQGYRALETYLVETGCANHALALARRPRYLIEADMRWANDYMTDLESKGL